MTTETGVKSQNEGAPLDGGAAKPKAPGRDPTLVDRDALLADMDAKIEARRKQENEEFLQSSDVDPSAWLLHQRMQAEAKGQALETAQPPPTDEEPEDLEDGTGSVEPVSKAAPRAQPAERISTKGEDPLAQYVVRVDGKPMMKTVVYGQERLIPLEVARRELQKIGAGDERLRQAAAAQKELDARAAQLKKTEAELAARAQRPTAETAPADDRFLETEAVDIVRSLVTEPEDKAAARLAKTLKTIRQAQGPQIDVDAITRRAVDEAKRTLVEHDTNRALQSGFKTFTESYRDIASDPELFAIADKKTDVIAAEHPEWDPGQVMLEAGKQTREWMQSMGMKTPTAPPAPPTSNRQQRKEGLRPMPTQRIARAATTSEEKGQTPADTMAEIRKARGQAY